MNIENIYIKNDEQQVKIRSSEIKSIELTEKDNNKLSKLELILRFKNSNINHIEFKKYIDLIELLAKSKLVNKEKNNFFITINFGADKEIKTYKIKNKNLNFKSKEQENGDAILGILVIKKKNIDDLEKLLNNN